MFGEKQKLAGFSLVQIMAAIALLALVFCGAVKAVESKYASGTTSAAVTFGPAGGGRIVVKSVCATCDKEDGAVKFYARGGAGKKAITTAQSAASTTCAVSNASYGFTTNDTVVVVHANGTSEYRTISTASTTSVVLNSATSAALTTDGFIYEVTQLGQIVVGFDGAAAGTNDTVAVAGDVFATPGDSPLYAVLDGTSNAVLQVTADK